MSHCTSIINKLYMNVEEKGREGAGLGCIDLDKISLVGCTYIKMVWRHTNFCYNFPS